MVIIFALRNRICKYENIELCISKSGHYSLVRYRYISKKYGGRHYFLSKKQNKKNGILCEFKKKLFANFDAQKMVRKNYNNRSFSKIAYQ